MGQTEASAETPVGGDHLAAALGLELEGGGGDPMVLHIALRSFDIDPLDIKCLDLEVHHCASVAAEVVRCQDV